MWWLRSTLAVSAEHFVLKDVKGVPVVIQYNDLNDHFNKLTPVAKKVLQSAEWIVT